jgi:NADH pyrophosphatase NudC (nudix superfamily)
MFTLHDAVFPEGFHQKKHFLMVDFLAKAKSEKFKLDKKEGTKGVWMKPKLALKELKMDQFTQKALEDYVKIMDLTKVV